VQLIVPANVTETKRVSVLDAGWPIGAMSVTTRNRAASTVAKIFK
jgi:hypothetical protein